MKPGALGTTHRLAVTSVAAFLLPALQKAKVACNAGLFTSLLRMMDLLSGGFTLTTEIVDKSAAFTGRCLCGKVAFAAEGPPAFAGFCYCTRCGRMSGSGRTPFLGFEDGMISVSGEMESFHDEGEAGSIERLFCGTCGTRMLARPGSAPGITILYAGGLDDPTLFKPEIAIHVAQCPQWEAVSAGLAAFEGDAPP